MSELTPDHTRLEAWRLFLVSHRRVLSILADELRGDEWLSLPWYDVLVQLSDAEDHRLRFQDLAHSVVLSPSGLSRLIDRMEQDGLVTREPCEDDRRGTYAVMTSAGNERLVATAPHHLAGVHEHFTSHLSEAEALTMTNVLQRILTDIAAT